ncbi:MULTISPECIES: hypothetical protein [Amycolatopsis]|uniref:hypothetical protein n=1 Tax=Amycolatopsis sp. cg13 TaxID=3238807 RepID=UPI003525D3C0
MVSIARQIRYPLLRNCSVQSTFHRFGGHESPKRRHSDADGFRAVAGRLAQFEHFETRGGHGCGQFVVQASGHRERHVEEFQRVRVELSEAAQPVEITRRKVAREA